jgi:uncharacterized protein (DUF3084 family)
MANSGLAITVSQQLVTEECCKCHCLFAITQDLYRRAKDSGETFWCPLGHSQSYLETTVMKLEKEKAALARQLDIAKQDARNEMARREQAEKKQRRLQKRVSAGVCPYCKRTIGQLAAHMKTKHPDHIEVKK